MYVLVTMFTLGPGMRATADKLAEQFAPILRSQKEFKSVTFLGDDTVGEYGAFSLWESKEDAEATLTATEPPLKQAFSGIVKGPPTRRVFEVFEPKA